MSKLRPYLAEIASAIREKKGSSEPINAKDFSNEIRNIQSGAAPVVEEKDVNFYDYDGTLLFSYTIEEAQALTELPTPPTHEGLVFDGWNWDYEDVIALDYPMDIGALYVTDDGATRFYIQIKSEEEKLIYFGVRVNSPFLTIIDWGDGTQEETSISGVYKTTHEYAQIGYYIITITSNTTLNIVGMTFGELYQNANRTTLKKIELGRHVNAFDAFALRYCKSLETITLHRGVTSISPYYAFQQCSSLKFVSLPNNINNIGMYNFSNCLSLQRISLPKGITEIGNFSFNNCSSLQSICLSKNIVSIGTNVFERCMQLRKVSLPNQILTSIGNNAFTYCVGLREVELPNSLTTIGNNVFQLNMNINKIVFPENITNIPTYCCSECNLMELVIFPKNLKSIQTYAFYLLSSCNVLDFSKCIEIPTLSNTNAFLSLPTFTKIIVPDALYDAWKAATNWSTYADRIVKASEYNG